jgi:hypothetical protein
VNTTEHLAQTSTLPFQAINLRPRPHVAHELVHLLPNPLPAYPLPDQQKRTPFFKASSFTISDMGDQSRSFRLQALFECALQDYEKNTNITLAIHPLSHQLENCHSVESITCLLQDQARACGFRGSDRIMKSIQSTVSLLYKLSATVALGDGIGLVRQKTLLGLCNA